MKKAKQRSKQRAAALAFWERTVQQSVSEVREDLHLAADGRIPDAVLVREIIALGDPYATPSRDAAVPGGDIETAKKWIRARLRGEADTEAGRTQLAQAIAPLPDHDPYPAIGMNRRILERAIKYDANKQRGLQE